MNEWPILLTKLWEQFYLVGLSLFFAMLIGLPLGIIIRNFKSGKSIILGIASALWTIPSLALLAFFIPLVGIGVKPAIIVLSLYAILPILRNTVTGLDNVSSSSIEAARGLGFTKMQRLWMVELPLAFPVILAGIRTSVTMSIAIATLAAFIGAGGLGDFINQGLALNNTNLLLLGSIPAALMALIFDYALAYLETSLATPHVKKFRLKYTTKLLSVLIIALIIIGGIFSVLHYSGGQQRSIRIASKNFTEQIILGELIAQLLETKTPLHVVRKFNLGSTAICHAALLNNEIDLYPEYTGTAYLTVLNYHKIIPANSLYAVVKSEYEKRFNLIWLTPFGFNNTQALAVKNTFALQHHLKNISDLKNIESQLIIGVPAEFMQREDALIGLTRVYHLQFGQIRQMDPGLMYKAIETDEVNLINAFSTDGRIPAYHLVLLNDDKHFYPDYHAAPIIRADILQAYPEIENVLKPLLGSIDDKTMRELNYQVDIQHVTPYQVAKSFLKSRKLI